MNLQVINFIKQHLQAAKENEEKTGIPFLAVLAQSALETGWGRCVKGNNFFGVKAGKSFKGKTQNFTTWEHLDGKDVKLKDNFRAYESFAESLSDYSDLILRKYKPALEAETPEQYVEALQTKCEDKYATDPNYVQKLKSIINTISRLLSQDDVIGSADTKGGEIPPSAEAPKKEKKK